MPSGTGLTVLQSSRAPRPTTNPYLAQLVASLTDHITVHYFSWKTALFGRYDILHVQWPDLLVRSGAGRLRTGVRQALFGLLLLRIRLAGTAVVRTAHNLAPHESGHRVETWLLDRLDRMTTLWITLNEQTRIPTQAPRTTIAHGHYRTWYADYPRPEATPGRVTYFGLIRPYKGVLALCAAAGEVTKPELTLRIVGKPSSDHLADQITAACAGDHRITATLAYLDEASLTAEIGAAELVVLPYDDMHNSGAVLLALSLERPVLVPRTDVNLALGAEVGTSWIQTYDPPIRGHDLIQAIDTIRGSEPPTGPDLSARNWPDLGRQHLDAYRAALRSVRIRRRGLRRGRGPHRS